MHEKFRIVRSRIFVLVQTIAKVPTLFNEVLARQRRTNSSDFLVKKGTSLKEIDEKFQDQITKGYIEKIDLKTENIYRKDSYFLSYFPVVNRTKSVSDISV